ncbi:hypothetical protein FRC01_002270 [Tulasnella sp. 417]|nr:hypothetical protein FRC01_002270 [Tulasnella sp. 417]
MSRFPVPPGISRKDYVDQLREEAETKIPHSVNLIIRHQTIIVQYIERLSWKEEWDVVTDLARVLPEIEPLLYVWKIPAFAARPSRFAVFLSDFNEDPLAQRLRGRHEKLMNALLRYSGSTQYLTQFVCRRVGIEEKMEVADLVTGYELPFEGAALIIQRDRRAIQAYEAEYDEAVKAYRNQQSGLVLENRHQAQHTRDGSLKEDSNLAREEVRAVGRRKRRRGSKAVGKGKEGGNSTGAKRKSGWDREEVAATPGTSGPSSASTSAPTGPPSKRQRPNDTGLDPISSKDREKWVNHVLASDGPRGRNNRFDLLREFLSANGQDRNWTITQWNTYLKDNRACIIKQIARVKRQSQK